MKIPMQIKDSDIVKKDYRHTIGALNNGDTGYFTVDISNSGYTPLLATAMVSSVAVNKGNLLLNASIVPPNAYVTYKAFAAVAAGSSDIIISVLYKKA